MGGGDTLAVAVMGAVWEPCLPFDLIFGLPREGLSIRFGGLEPLVYAATMSAWPGGGVVNGVCDSLDRLIDAKCGRPVRGSLPSSHSEPQSA